MKIHYYGMLDSLESCYTYQAFDIDGITMLLQNAPRFGYEPATMNIKNPAMFIKKADGYYRFVIEDFTVFVENGLIRIDKDTLFSIIKEVSNII